MLSSISARNNRNGSDELTEHLKQIQEYSHDVNSSLSEIVWAVSPKHDSLESLLIYMQKYIHDFFENTGVNYQIKFPTTFENIMLNPELKRNIFLVQKESLNNILKYAHAKNVSIGFKIAQNNFELKVMDDGIGFDSNNATNGNGLTNMKYRMQTSGGDFKINSTAGSGSEMVATGKLI